MTKDTSFAELVFATITLSIVMMDMLSYKILLIKQQRGYQMGNMSRRLNTELFFH